MKIVSIPFSGGSLGNNLGCEEAPKSILGISGYKNFIEVPVDNHNIDLTFENISKTIFGANGLFILGGDHSITYSVFKTVNKNYGLIIFDAHPDVQSSDFVTHEDYLRMLIEDNIIDPSKIILVGIRAGSKEEMDYLKNKGIVYFDINSILDLGLEEVCNLAMERALQWGGVYLSIDIDVVDPAYAPGTGYLEPGGLSSKELLYFLSRIKKMRNLKFVDLVEVNPKRDFNNLTLLLSKKIMEEFL